MSPSDSQPRQKGYLHSSWATGTGIPVGTFGAAAGAARLPARDGLKPQLANVGSLRPRLCPPVCRCLWPERSTLCAV